jgi:acyl-CoA oxidase
MQKVAKELLAAYQSKKISYPSIDSASAASWSIKEMDTLMKLIRLREIMLLNELGKNMNTKLSKGATIFDVWMKEESDLIQATSRAFGHRICLESILSSISKEDGEGIK